MKMNLKKVLAMGLLCAVGCGFTAMGEAGSFKLSEDVKAPTIALKQAAQVGLLTHETAELQNLADKDAILVMSFGTTIKETREKNIDATVNAIKALYPDTKVVVAYTSHIIIDRVKANEGLVIPTPEEALAQLKAEGYTRVAMTSLDIIPGIEYDYKKAVFNLHKNDFKKVTFGTPLMYWQGQEGKDDDVAATMQALATQFPETGKKDAVLVMAHGTPHPANAYYAVMQDKLIDLGYENALLFSVEGWPAFDNVLEELKERKIKNVTMMPLMMVAGDHAMNDMAGDEEDSFKSLLVKEGYNVDVYLHGLGENVDVQNLFVKKASQAWEALQAK
ncbi:MAG: sirohydrochlorin cobaltochelatase [Phascolarctobacterium sp.]|nr:sirohydrochlorin cobaltochelatase [Phascolarctobacterium sp.]